MGIVKHAKECEMTQEAKYHIDQRVKITAIDDRFVGSEGTVKAVKPRTYPKRITYMVAIDGTGYELWYAEWEITTTTK